MLNYIFGKIKTIDDKIFLINDKLGIGIEIIYNGEIKEGNFFIYPYIEQNINTIIYFGFPNINQKRLFEKLIKIPGIGPKTAYNISTIPQADLRRALDKNDIKFFTQIPGIGQKTAKRILIELKENFDKIDFENINIDEKIFKKITKTLSNLGYEKKQIQNLLQECPIELKEKNLEKIIKWLLDNLK